LATFGSIHQIFQTAEGLGRGNRREQAAMGRMGFLAEVSNQISLMKWVNAFKLAGLKFAIHGNFTLGFRPFHK